ncbi:MAG: bifunctional glycosyltransferase family 2/GtrA family protein [Candidatus Solibacter usitatus]|nr:bifunctional glycosyltransferase family 2/GtrA family protein [Candidatus Solibacter usitatus]
MSVVIPAFQPGVELRTVVEALLAAGMEEILVIDDGSGPDYAERFETLRHIPRVQVLRHAVNLGKGAAIKTGLNHVLCTRGKDAGIVTADADGQHHADDIVRIARALTETPQMLVLGARRFEGKVPLRSRFGNAVTRSLFRLLIGPAVTDTQTGLRGIPVALASHLLRMTSSGYEFELDMLIAARAMGLKVREEPIRTIYGPGNRSSHFNPLLDSMKIYFVLLRFAALSLSTAILDNVVFALLYHFGAQIAVAQLGARAASVCYNYPLVRSAVFTSTQKHRAAFPKYLLLVAFNAVLSYALIVFLQSYVSFGVMPAKLTAESILFIASFALQRDFVFKQGER